MRNNLTRRRFGLTAITGLAVAIMPPLPLQALTKERATVLVERLVADILRVINSGKRGTALYRDFERIFDRYADLNIIARQALGVDARRASATQLRAFTAAFSGYVSRKYGRRFREFIGGRIEVKSTAKVKSFYEVRTIAHLRGQAPFEVTFLISDRSGRDKFFNMFIEGVNMMLTERAEIGALLDRNRGNIDALIADLRKIG